MVKLNFDKNFGSAPTLKIRKESKTIVCLLFLAIFLFSFAITSAEKSVSVMKRKEEGNLTGEAGGEIDFPVYIFNDARFSEDNYRATLENIHINGPGDENYHLLNPMNENQRVVAPNGFEISYKLLNNWSEDYPAEPLVPPRYSSENLPRQVDQPSYVDGYVSDGENFLPVRLLNVKVSIPENLSSGSYYFTFLFREVPVSGNGPSGGLGVNYVPNMTQGVDVVTPREDESDGFSMGLVIGIIFAVILAIIGFILFFFVLREEEQKSENGSNL